MAISANEKLVLAVEADDFETALNLWAEGDVDLEATHIPLQATINQKKFDFLIKLSQSSNTALLQWSRALEDHDEDLIGILRDANENELADRLYKERYSNSREFFRAAKEGDLETVRNFIMAGFVDIDAQDGEDKTALYLASSEGQESVVDFLLESGASLGIETENKYIDISAAAYGGYGRIVEKLIEKAKAIYADDLKKFYEYLTHVDDGNDSVLVDARRGGLEHLIKPHIDELREQIPREKIAIIGGGFSGTIAAIKLLESSRNDDVELILIERDEAARTGGLAYGKENAGDGQVLNIQAQRASLDPNDSNDFINWLEHRHWDIYHNHSDAVPRKVYQEYLSERLEDAIGSSEMPVTKTTGKVVDINEDEQEIIFDDGKKIAVSHAILATGHTTSVQAKFFNDVKDDERVLLSQWGPRGRAFFDGIGKDESVFVLGTSLSAKDVVVSLKRRGHKGPIVMMSRHGYLHATYEPRTIPERVGINAPSFIDDITGEVAVEEELIEEREERPDLIIEGLRQLSSGLAGAFNRASGNDNEPERSIERSRPATRKLSEDEVVESFIKAVKQEWFRLTRQNRYTSEQILSEWERHIPETIEALTDAGVSKLRIAKLIYDHKSLISTSRVGASPAIGEVVNDAQIDGQLQIWEGHIKSLESKSEGVEVTYEVSGPDGNKAQYSKVFNRVVSSLGQQMDYRKVTDPLWVNLMEKGTVASHWTNIGINVDEDGQVVKADGLSSTFITAVGTMRGGDTMVRDRSYGEKPGSGGRFSPFNHNIAGIRDQFGWAEAQKVLELVHTNAQHNVESRADSIVKARRKPLAEGGIVALP